MEGDGYVEPPSVGGGADADGEGAPPAATADDGYATVPADLNMKKKKKKTMRKKKKKTTTKTKKRAAMRGGFEADESALQRERADNERVSRLASNYVELYTTTTEDEGSADEDGTFLPFFASPPADDGAHAGSGKEDNDEDEVAPSPSQAYGFAGEGSRMYSLYETETDAEDLPALNLDAPEEARLDCAYSFSPDEIQAYTEAPQSPTPERSEVLKAAYAQVAGNEHSDVYSVVADSQQQGSGVQTSDEDIESESESETSDESFDSDLDSEDGDDSDLESDDSDQLHEVQRAPPQTGRQWNEEFQRLCQPLGSDDSELLLKRSYSIYKLFLEFQESASDIGRVIIDEIHVPRSRKTYPPVDVGGQAGGVKYMHNNIFFKFCFDVNGYYGGDEFAMKSAGRELAGLRAYYKFINERNKHDLHVPLMIVIDYKGYRLIATSVLPLGKDTLVYGSADGGVTVHAENKKMNVLMKDAAEYLGIKGHIVGFKNPTKIYGPADIEGHLGKDGRLYVLDTARVYPPTPPSSSVRALLIRADKQGEALTSAKCIDVIDLTRAQFEGEARQLLVAQNKNRRKNGGPMVGEQASLTEAQLMDQIGKRVLPYMGSIMFHQEHGEINLIASSLAQCAVRGDAILIPAGYQGRHLYNLFRSEFVSYYAKETGKPLSSDAFTGFGRDKMAIHNREVRDASNFMLQQRIPEVVQDLETKSCPYDGSQLTYYMHQNGINMRFLGRLWRIKNTASTNIRVLVLVEMITRAVKVVLRSVMRTCSSEQEMALQIVKHFNLLLGKSDASRIYWISLVRTQLLFKFDFDLSSEEKTAWELISSESFTHSLYKRLQTQLGIKFASGFEPDFSLPYPLSIAQYMGIIPIVSELISESSLNEAMHKAIERTSLVLNDIINTDDYTSTRHVASTEQRNKMKLRMRKTISTLLERALGVGDYRVAAARFSIACTQHELGKHRKALQLIKAIFDEHAELPVEIIILGRCLRGRIYFAMGDSDKAISDYYNALCIANPHFGEGANPSEVLGHPITLYVLDNLAHALYKQHQYAILQQISLQFGLLLLKFCPYTTAPIQKKIWGMEFPLLLGYFITRLKRISQKGQSYTDFLGQMFYKFQHTHVLGLHSEVVNTYPELPSNDDIIRAYAFLAKMHQFKDFQFTENMATGLMMSTTLALRKNATLLLNQTSSSETKWYKVRSPSPEDKYKLNVSPFEVVSKDTITINWEHIRPEGGRQDPVSLVVAIYPCRDWDATFECWEDEYGAIRKMNLNIEPLKKVAVAGSEGTAQLDMSGLEPGNYWVTLNNEKEAWGIKAVSWVMVLPHESVKKRLVQFIATSHIKNDKNIKARVMHHFNGKHVVSMASVGGWFDNLSPVKTFVATDDRNVYSWSYNQQLSGLGHSSQDFDMVQNPTPISLLAGRKVIKVAVAAYDFTNMHALVLTEDKRVYSWGSNRQSQLGHGTESNEEPIGVIESLEGEAVVDIACGKRNSKAVTGDGRVLVWGANEDNLKQFQYESHNNPYPVELQGITQRIVAISSGEKTSVALSEEGMVWMWGLNVGIRNQEDKFIRTPALVDALVCHCIVDIACGEKFIALLSDQGKVFCSGVGQFGVLGNGSNQDRYLLHGVREPPREAPPAHVEPVQGHLADKKVVQISAQDTLCCALTNEGEVYYWGSGHFWPQLARELAEQGRGDKNSRIKRVFAGTAGRLYASIDESTPEKPRFPPLGRLTSRGQALREKLLQSWKTSFSADRHELSVSANGDPQGVQVKWSRANLQHLNEWSIGLYNQNDIGMHFEHRDKGCIREWPAKGHEMLDETSQKWNGALHLKIDFYLQPGTYLLVMKKHGRVTISSPFFLSLAIEVHAEDVKNEEMSTSSTSLHHEVAEDAVTLPEPDTNLQPVSLEEASRTSAPPESLNTPAVVTPPVSTPALIPQSSATIPTMMPAFGHNAQIMQTMTNMYTQQIMAMQQAMMTAVSAQTAAGAPPEQITAVMNSYMQAIQSIQQAMMTSMTLMQGQPMAMGMPGATGMNPMMPGQQHQQQASSVLPSAQTPSTQPSRPEDKP